MSAKVKGRGSSGGGGGAGGGGPRYRGPYGTPLAHVQYQQGRHLNPERTPFHRHEKPVSIRLLDVSKESLDNLRKVAASIKRLLAPSLQLKSVPDSLVAYVDHLERLDLGHNRLADSSFPDPMKCLDRLVELSLNHNQLTRVPACLRRMRNLVRLNLSDNQLESVAGLERLKKLQFLVLDNNNLSAVFREISGLRKLEMLRISSNHLRDVPRDIRTLRQLKDLDLSNNRILLLPTDVFQLPRLEFLNASQNQVSKIPSFNVKVQNRHWISCVDLSENHLVKFPGHLMHLAHKLDLSANKIRTLSWSSFKKLDDRVQELILECNPLVYPPPDVCLSGLKTIVHFFQESQADVKTYQGVKVLVMGSHRSGKSSLVYSLVDQQARLSQDMTDSASGIDAYEMSFDYDAGEGNPGTSLNLCLWDFCGDPFYLYPHYLFHEHPSITILTFSLPEYTDHTFGQQIGSWFDWMIAKSNKLVVILVATQSDRVTDKRALAVTQQVRSRLADHLQARQRMMEARIREIEARPVISPTLSEQLKTYMRLLQAKFTVQTEVIVTSSRDFTGFGKLREAVEALAGDRRLFPHVMRVIPTFWVEVEHWAEERGNALLVPVMAWDAFSEEVTQRFGMKHLLNAITQYLHDAGKVLWFSAVPSLKNLVFLRPAWLFDLLRLLFRPDPQAAAFTPDDTLKAVGLTPGKFERLKHEFVQEGAVERELLRGLLVSLLPADLSEPMSEVIRILTEGLEMGYPVSRAPHDLTFSYAPDKESPPDAKPTVHKLLLPWFRRGAEPASFRQQWRRLRSRRRLAVLFRFPAYMPPGLFEIMTVLAHREKHRLVFLSHWGGGVHARHRTEKVQLFVTYCTEGALDEDVDDDNDNDDDEEEFEKTFLEEGRTPPATATRNSLSNGDAVFRATEDRSGSGPKTTTTMMMMMTSNSKGPISKPLKGNVTNSPDDASAGGGGGGGAQTKPRKAVHESSFRQDSIQEDDEEDKDGDDDDDEEEEEDDDDEEEEDDEEEGDDKEEAEEPFQAEGPVRSVESNGENGTEDRRRSSPNGATTTTTLVDREAGESRRSVTSKRRPTPSSPKVKVDRQRDSIQSKNVTGRETEGGGAGGSVVLRFELRDTSPDPQDQTPAASMWNVLLPLLMDFEDLLQRYAGVLVERRTQCPLCGQGSFSGEWLTPKETQGLNTRTCDSCHQQVDTAFLVQPREKKRVIINRNRFKRPPPSNNPDTGEKNTISCAPSSDAPCADAGRQ